MGGDIRALFLDLSTRVQIGHQNLSFVLREILLDSRYKMALLLSRSFRLFYHRFLTLLRPDRATYRFH